MASAAPDPTPTTDSLSFVSVSATDDPGKIEAGMPADPAGDASGQVHMPRTFKPATEFLNRKGLGWLFEYEEEEEEENTSLMEELDVDLKDIFVKVKCVMLPFTVNRQVLRDEGDFWGPLLIVVVYAFLIVWGQFKAVPWTLLLWFFGSFLIYFLGRVLGGETSYSQCVSVLGYSLLPLSLVAFVNLFFSSLTTVFAVSKAVAIIWCTYSAGSLLVPFDMERKRLLVMYPIMLLYIYFAQLQSGV